MEHHVKVGNSYTMRTGLTSKIFPRVSSALPSSLIIKNEDDIEECKQRDQLQIELKENRRALERKKEECDTKKYANMRECFNAQDKNTIKDLLRCLHKLYTKKRKKHGADYNLSLLTFLEYFPATTTAGISNFRRQHVFEAICKAMLVLNYDNNHWGKKKKFYKSLEAYVKSETGRKEEKVNAIWNEKMNESSAAGSVDIFFKIAGDENADVEEQEYQEEALCERNFEEEKKRRRGKKKDLFVMIQNKYYAHEYSTADKYDITKILSRASPLSSDEFNSSVTKLILMVNNKQDLLTKIKKNRNSDFELVPEDQIFGVEELNDWFLRMLYNIEISDDFDSFLKIQPENNEDLQLRFHQKFFVNTTSAYLNEEVMEEKRKKFVWGAVPRSGKSYMIGGLINKRQSDTVLIVLGAKSETETQFVEMFKKFNNFKDYEIRTASKTTHKNKKAKNIIILSQEKLKVKGRKAKKGKEDPKLDEKFWEEYKEFFPPNKPIDLYFDEIHKGGSTPKAQEQIIQAFLGKKYIIDLFVMVTATYAKPTIAYSSVIDTHNPIILNWSYSDQQDMKKVSDDKIRQEIIHSRSDELQQKQLADLFVDYERQYQSQYLSILEEEYKKNPELVILRGEKTAELMNIHGNTFLLKCSAVAATKEQAKDPTQIFVNNQGVIDLINSIGHYENKSGGDILPDSTLYGNLTYNFGYDVMNTRHTQLWFLPYNHLYESGNKCPKPKKNIKQATTGEESKDEMEERQGLPNIEPLTRGMVLNLLKNPFFKKNFCFLIVHGQKLKYFKEEIDWADKGECVDLSVGKRKPINIIIKEFEEKSFKEGKSLIILTGSMLRLGISISCADIAFNFDNIKSVDLNYQTMFRVLTERHKKNGKWKEYGYYYDFYPERASEFLYEYNLTYVDSLKKAENMKQSVESLQALLYLFNYDGLGIVKGDTEKTLNIYENLITDLKLTEKDYSEHFIKDSEKSILSLLKTNPISERLLAKINKLNLQGSFNIKNIKFKKKGKPQEHAYRPPLAADKDEDPEEEDPEEEDAPLSHQDIMLYIKDYTAILALFSDPGNNNCENISECIEKVKKNTNFFRKLCECERIPIPVLGCYMERIKGYSKKLFSASLDTFKEIIDEDPRYRNRVNIIFDSIKEAMGKSSMLIYDKTPKEVDDIIQKHLPVRKKEKDTYGEVFTPPTLINEMLDKLPKSVWKNKDLKWLDPANGTGNFPMVAYTKLMDGLKSEIPDKQKRSDHIIKKMLYMVELNPKNVAISRKIFGPEANIACANFLTEEDKWKRKFEGVDTFDIIMGNPPWNNPKGKKSGTQSKSGELWTKFVIKAFNNLKENGFLCFIHPSNWRGLGPKFRKIWDLLSQKQILYLHIYSKKNGLKCFGVSIRFDLYVLQNKPNTKSTEVIGELGKKQQLNLNKWDFFPNFDYKNIKKIINDVPNEGNVIYNSSFYHTQNKKKNMKKKKQGAFKYPVVHTITQGGKLNCWYTNDKSPGHFGVPKVLLTKNELQYPYNDYNGKYGMTEVTFGIPIKSKAEGDKIVKAINSPAFKEIIKATKWSTGLPQTDYRMFKYFKPNFYKNSMFKVGPKTRKHHSVPLPSKKHTRKQRSVPLPSRKHTKKRKHRSLSSKKHTRKHHSMPLPSKKHMRKQHSMPRQKRRRMKDGHRRRTLRYKVGSIRRTIRNFFK